MNLESVLKDAEDLCETLLTDVNRYEDDLLIMLQIGVYHMAAQNLVDALRELTPQRGSKRPRHLTLVK